MPYKIPSCTCDIPASFGGIPAGIPASATSQLDTVETAVEMWDAGELAPYDQPRDDYRIEPLRLNEAEFRHSGWKVLRATIFDALIALHISASRLERFATCGSGAYVLYNPESKALRVAGNYCHDRFCLPCGAARSRVIAASLCEHCCDRTIRFITLTVRHNTTALVDQINRIYESFRRLRQRKLWKGTVVGGAAFLELKMGNDKLWHPHLHILAEGVFMDLRTLGAEWHAVTGDSFVVDIRKPKSEKELCNYVAKYASKPMDSSTLHTPSALAEAIVALRGRRLCLAFGSWKKIVLEPNVDVSQGWITLGRLDDLIRDAGAGDPQALRVLSALKRPLNVGRPSHIDGS